MTRAEACRRLSRRLIQGPRRDSTSNYRRHRKPESNQYPITSTSNTMTITLNLLYIVLPTLWSSGASDGTSRSKTILRSSHTGNVSVSLRWSSIPIWTLGLILANWPFTPGKYAKYNIVSPSNVRQCYTEQHKRRVLCIILLSEHHFILIAFDRAGHSLRQIKHPYGCGTFCLLYPRSRWWWEAVDFN